MRIRCTNGDPKNVTIHDDSGELLGIIVQDMTISMKPREDVTVQMNAYLQDVDIDVAKENCTLTIGTLPLFVDFMEQLVAGDGEWTDSQGHRLKDNLFFNRALHAYKLMTEKQS